MPLTGPEPDGGGTRIYWSLLALQKLMEYVAAEEQPRAVEEPEILHSFYPEDWPGKVSLQRSTELEECDEVTKTQDRQAALRMMSKARRFLPCHYFDIICGSSTGG